MPDQHLQKRDNALAKLRDLRENKLNKSNSQQFDQNLYNDAHNIWLLLAILAGCLGHGGLASEPALAPFTEAHLHQIIKDILNANPSNKKQMAEICCSLHWQICGHCACP